MNNWKTILFALALVFVGTSKVQADGSHGNAVQEKDAEETEEPAPKVCLSADSVLLSGVREDILIRLNVPVFVKQNEKNVFAVWGKGQIDMGGYGDAWAGPYCYVRLKDVPFGGTTLKAGTTLVAKKASGYTYPENPGLDNYSRSVRFELENKPIYALDCHTDKKAKELKNAPEPTLGDLKRAFGTLATVSVNCK